MKKIIAVVLAFLLCLGVFSFSLNYKNKMVDKKNNGVGYDFTTTEATTGTTIHYSNDKPIAVSADKEYELYYDGEIVTIVHGNISHIERNWKLVFDSEIPEPISVDVDNDGEKELILKLRASSIINVENRQMNTYTVFLFKPVKDADGTPRFNTYVASMDTWKVPFEETVRAEVTQLKSCNKILQFTMADVGKQIEYDKNGFSTSKYTGFASALPISENKNTYYELSGWLLGNGYYSVSKNGKISLDIEVLAEYENSAVKQLIGHIHCNIAFKDNQLSLVPKQIKFVPKDNFRVADPTIKLKNNWSVEINNSGNIKDISNKDINWIENEFDISSMQSTSQSFADMQSKIKYVDKIEFNQSGVVLTAKEGYAFTQSIAANGKFSVTIKDKQNKDIDISYKAAVKEVGGKSTLVITFDRAYNQSELKGAKIKFGI